MESITLIDPYPGALLCRLFSAILGGSSASQNGHAKASSPVFTLRRSFSSTLCLGHFSSAMLVVYAGSKYLRTSLRRDSLHAKKRSSFLNCLSLEYR